ncbi:MAG: HAD family hydrolase [Methanomassiliicoccus sp.]|nr:HAD family hydrolase [Methanomassiliicoccus sp.]
MSGIISGDIQIRGVVLDLDGTLIHTTVDFSLMKRRMIASLAQIGVPLSMLDPGSLMLDIMDRSIRYLNAEGRSTEAKEIASMAVVMMNHTELERVSETRPIGGAGECIERLRGGGYKIALLTRGSRAYALSALRFAGLDVEFDAVVCRDDFPEEEAKPNGKAMLRVASMLGLTPEDCVLVGDHSMDLQCARSASSRFVGVLSGSFSAEDWSKAGCEDIIDSVSSLPHLLMKND